MGGTWLLGWITLPVGLVIGYKRWPLWAHLIVPIVVSGIVMNVSVGRVTHSFSSLLSSYSGRRR
jgi:hypothetical protein